VKTMPNKERKRSYSPHCKGQWGIVTHKFLGKKKKNLGHVREKRGILGLHPWYAGCWKKLKKEDCHLESQGAHLIASTTTPQGARWMGDDGHILLRESHSSQINTKGGQNSTGRTWQRGQPPWDKVKMGGSAGKSEKKA